MAPENLQMASKKKMIQIKKMVLTIVEEMIETNIDKDSFLKNCTKLSQSDYDDVVQERSIEHLCGYPMCSKAIKAIKQKYHINRCENKVYDITERKNFCSNQCYKASNFLKNQLHSLPLYMRKSEVFPVVLNLLSEAENRGSAGEEIIFQPSISKSKIDETYSETKVAIDLTSMLQEDIKDCTEHLAGLKIKENVYKCKYEFGSENVDEPVGCVDFSETSDSDVSENENKSLFRDYDNGQMLSDKHMPVSVKTKKAVLISPLRATRASTTNRTKLVIDYVAKVFQDWFTEDTMKYLLGERKVFSIKADRLFKTLVDSDQSPEKLSSTKDEYINLCLKIDKLPEVEDEMSDTLDISISDIDKEKEAKHDSIEKTAEKYALKSASGKTNLKKRTRKSSQSKKKSVSFASDVKSGCEKSKKEDDDFKSQSEPVLPLVDSLSQNILRKQILISKLKNMFVNILPVIDLHYRDIKDELKLIVDTFSLNPTNIIHKPKQTKCIAVVLYRVLTKTTVKELRSDSLFTKLCENTTSALDISKEEIENLASDLVSPSQVLRLENNTVEY